MSLGVPLALAAALRLPFPRLSPFGHDEALEAIRARPIWYGARPVESEITSWFIPDPAGMLYLFALTEGFDRPAVARVLMMAALNVVAVGLTYAIAARYWGRWAGFAAALTMAVNPWAVTFARQPWVITQPLVTCLMMLAGWRVVVDRDARWIVPFFVAGAIQTQTHLLSVLLGPPVVLTLLLFPRAWFRWQTVVGGILALAIVAPYGLHLWSIRDDVVDALGRGDRGLALGADATAVRLTAWFLSGQGLELKLGVPDSALAALSPLALVPLTLLGGALVVGVAACVLWPVPRRADVLLLVWFGVPLGLMTWQSSAVYIHYVLTLLPVLFLLVGRGIAVIARQWPTPALVVLAIAGAPHVVLVAAFYQGLDEMATAPRSNISPTAWQEAANARDAIARRLGVGEIHGLPLDYWQGVADATKPAVAGVTDVLVMTGIEDDGERHLDKRRKALEYLLGPELQSRFPLDGLTVLPANRRSVLMTIPEQDPPRAATRDALKVMELHQPGTNSATRAWISPGRSVGELVQPRAAANVLFDCGVRALGVDAPARAQPGQSVRLTTYWSIEQAVRLNGRDLTTGVALTDAGGAVRATARRGGLPSAEWRDSDLLVQQITLVVPTGAFSELILRATLDGPSGDVCAPMTSPVLGTIRGAP